MSQLLNKLTNLVVSKITDENLIQTGGGQGSPKVILVDEDNDVTYGPDDYSAVTIMLTQNGVQYTYGYSKDSNLSTNPELLELSQLKQGFYLITSNSIVTTMDSSFQDTTYQVKSDTLINYTGQDSITIPINVPTQGELGR